MRLVLFSVAAFIAGGAGAQDEEPDLSFLEYLGSWQESDEEWLVVAGMEEEGPEAEDEASGTDEETDGTDDEK
jgi:hypothetical protein